jgi:hypothetical protein
MNASKTLIGMMAAFAIGMTSTGAYAVQGLGASGQTKVNNAMAKRWSEQAKGEKTPTDEKRMVNVGSRREGTCNVNVGTAQAGGRGRQPKDIVVTTKEVINVCK